MNLAEMSKSARGVRGEHEALNAAKEAKLVAEEKLLTALIEAIRVALPAMSCRVEGRRGVLVDRALKLYLSEDGSDWFFYTDGAIDGGHATKEVLLVVDIGEACTALKRQLYEQVGARTVSIAQINDEARGVLALAAMLTPPARMRR